MPQLEKMILQMCCTYFSMLNEHIESLHGRLHAAESVIQQSPDLSAKYQKAMDMQHRFSPGLGTQLSAIRKAIEKLPG